MRTADLVVGEDYTYRRYEYGDVERVRVLETRVQFAHEARQAGSVYTRRVRHTNGVRVALLLDSGRPSWQGAERVVLPRWIHGPWADYQARLDLARDHNAAIAMDRARSREQNEPHADLIERISGATLHRLGNGGVQVMPEDLARIAGALEGLGAG